VKRIELLAWYTPSISLAIKRGLDLLLSAAGLLLLTPVFLLLAVLIRLESHGPAIFRQERIGRGGRPFWLLKFRTMYFGSDDDLVQHLNVRPDERLGYDRFQKLVDDPRLTLLGRFLRRSSLDELPQLWNVLAGEMSLVGPRPILPSQTGIYGPGYAGYILARPGMTGLWQVSGRSQLSFAERAHLDQIYLGSWSLKLDLQILWKTIGVVISREGAY
jgi:lipopolysaccharide/colanic/teichoic acid biosynthesis glycosyltransferase